MRWSFRIARVFGIDIKVHLTFFLILGLGALSFGSRFGAEGALFGVLLMILLFTCVVLHELGHSIVAQRFGIPVREILLLPLGGLAMLGRNPSKPMHELLIALAGPLVNIVIAILLVPVMLVVIGPAAFTNLIVTFANLVVTPPSVESMLVWLLYANIMLVLFNMIPAFPLDGGRVFRSVLAMVISFRRATQIAAFTGQIFAILLGIVGILSGNILLLLVAAFIFFGAGQENAEGQARTMLTTLRVGDAYNKHALTLGIGDRVSKVVGYILTSYQPDFAVVQSGQLLGIVTRNDVMRALSESTQDVFVTGIMRREYVRVDASATLDEVRQTMGEKGERVVAVYNGEEYLGLVSIEDISEALAVLTFVQNQNEARRAEQAGAS